MSTGTIYLGDNVDSADLFIEDETVDLTVTSPPYDDMRKYTEDQEWSWAQFERVADMLYRVTRPGGVVVWNVADKTSAGAKSLTSFKQCLHFCDVGFQLADTMIWEKTGTSMGSNRLYHSNYEFMFILSKGAHRTFNPIKDRKNVVRGTQTVGGGGLVEGKSRTGARTIHSAEFGKRNNIWRINPAQRQKGHPAPFPVQLVRDHIRTWTNEGDVVFDPFMGSGTTAVAAEAEKRAWVGCEISEAYLALAERRIADARGQI